MAAGTGIWGIDIGQCALKALRCKLGEDGESIVADAFDYIEYPKILSQPEANRAELIHEALEQFLSRNSVRGDKVAISVSGQSGLARFFKPPPVEAKKIPDIVKYEARQQIPFALEEVIWDFQQMPGGAEEEGVALDTEVGLFAMKREHVFRALEPFEDAGIELDVVQLSPLTVYNFAAHDLLTDVPPPDEYDPDDPPESVVILSLGTDSTDLVVTNGYRVWRRSLPLGGNHFTRQLTTELKLTFAKAEHLKRNARQAEDPKTIFKAMRPVFNDLVTEVQRSISFFGSIDRKAKLKKMMLIGSATKLPGLQQYLAANLGMEVERVDKFRKLRGSAVLASPSFKDNLLAFPVCYGLCLQGLGKANLYTSLLPQEILTNRMIREKKPWAVAVASLILLACCAYFAFQMRQWRSADITRDEWETALQEVSGAKTTSQGLKREYEDRTTTVAGLNQLGYQVVGTAERRLLWPDLTKIIDVCLPRAATKDGKVAGPDVPLTERPELYIETVECQRFEDLAGWFTTDVADKYRKSIAAGLLPARTPAPAGDASAARALPGGALGAMTPGPLAQADTTMDDEEGESDGESGPSGRGWVIELRGYHFHNEDRKNRGVQYLRNTIIKNLLSGKITLPDGPGRPEKEFSTRELGVHFPVVIETSEIEPFPNPLLKPEDEAGPAPGESPDGEGPAPPSEPAQPP